MNAPTMAFPQPTKGTTRAQRAHQRAAAVDMFGKLVTRLEGMHRWRAIERRVREQERDCERMTTPPEQTFHDASLTIVEFAQRWREGKASLSEVEDAEVLLLGLRRLLSDHKAELTA